MRNDCVSVGGCNFLVSLIPLTNSDLTWSYTVSRTLLRNTRDPVIDIETAIDTLDPCCFCPSAINFFFCLTPRFAYCNSRWLKVKLNPTNSSIHPLSTITIFIPSFPSDNFYSSVFNLNTKIDTFGIVYDFWKASTKRSFCLKMVYYPRRQYFKKVFCQRVERPRRYRVRKKREVSIISVSYNITVSVLHLFLFIFLESHLESWSV